jgi:hypothetical protein
MIPSGYQTRGTMPPTLLRGGGARAQNAVEDLNRGGPAKLGRRPFERQTVLLHWSRAVGPDDIGRRRNEPVRGRASVLMKATVTEKLRFGDLRLPLKCSICQIMTAKKETCAQSALV